jgi:uncharacterized protein (DUF4415 family)
MPVGFHVLERFADIVEGEHLVYRQLQFARFLQKPDFPFGLQFWPLTSQATAARWAERRPQRCLDIYLYKRLDNCLVDGKPYQRKADGSLVPLKGKTDWRRLDRQTSVQTEAIAMKDRDGRPMSDEEWAKAEVIHPQKVPVGLKLDDDVLGWFKSQGKGYQTRINTILRRYYETHRRAG